MNIEVTTTERVEIATIPEGTWRGVWSGYEIEVPFPNEKWVLHTTTGVRGRVTVCVIADKQGKITAATV